MTKKKLVILAITMGALFTSAHAYPFIAHPPKGWECIDDPTQLPHKVKVIFVGKGSGHFTPSVNVATEETTLSTQDYVNLAKAYHEGQSGTRCTLLGKVQTEVGAAELIQVDRPSQWGDIRFLQAMIIQGGEAYVVTATCLKSEFSMHSSQILKAVQSLTLPERH